MNHNTYLSEVHFPTTGLKHGMKYSAACTLIDNVNVYLLLQPLLHLFIYIYIYMYTCSFIVHILPPLVNLYIIHYVFIAYSTLNIVSFVYIYIFINLFDFSLLNLFIYLSIFLRAVG